MYREQKKAFAEVKFFVLFLVMLATQYLLVSVMPYFVIICGVILYQLYSLIIVIIVVNSHIQVF